MFKIVSIFVCFEFKYKVKLKDFFIKYYDNGCDWSSSGLSFKFRETCEVNFLYTQVGFELQSTSRSSEKDHNYYGIVVFASYFFTATRRCGMGAKPGWVKYFSLLVHQITFSNDLNEVKTTDYKACIMIMAL